MREKHHCMVWTERTVSVKFTGNGLDSMACYLYIKKCVFCLVYLCDQKNLYSFFNLAVSSQLQGRVLSFIFHYFL